MGNTCAEHLEMCHCWVTHIFLLTREGSKRWALTPVLLFLGGKWSESWDRNEQTLMRTGVTVRVCECYRHTLSSAAKLLQPWILFFFFFSFTARQLGLPEAQRLLFSAAINSVWLIWVRLPKETLRPCPPTTPFCLLGFCPLLNGPQCSLPLALIPLDRWQVDRVDVF